MNGRIDLIQAEAINELIQAESIYAVRNALGKLKGGLSELVLKIRNKLIDLIADMEAEINFGETDQIENQGNYIKDINLIKKEIKEILKNHDNSRFITDNYKIAIVGKPNVGKSSLFNALLQKERAIITDIPGTTRDYIEDRIIIENLPVILIDTAGIRISNDKIEKIGIEKTKEIIDYSDKIIAVLDSATELDEQDMYIFKRWKDKICLVVMNKIDLAERIDIRAVEREVKAYKTPIIKTSIIKKLGIEEVRECIRKAIKTLISKRRNDAGYILNERQYDYLMNALKEIDKAKRDLLRGVSVEYAIMNLYEATKGLEELTGEISVEEVLDQIFSKFCIGK
jgi:tRNA modification GTPase